MKHRPKRILFIIHRLYFNGAAKKGGIDRFVEFLSERNAVTLIEHPFEQINHPSELTNQNKQIQHAARFRGFLLWIEEFFLNIYWVFLTKQKYNLAIASDPLNFFSCYFLKKLGIVKMTQFHSTDYSKPRFNTYFLEQLYQALYRFAITHADFVTVVSERMKDNAQHMSSKKNIHVLPNSPEFSIVPKIPYAEKNKNTLVLIVGRWGDQINTRLVVDCMKQLSELHSNSTLHIIGHVDAKYQKILKSNLSNYVLHGSVSYEKALSIMSTCTIGITAYNKTESYVHYADSIKIREYAAAGLPIVCDDIYATAQEVAKNNAGYVYKDTNDMVTAITRLLDNSKEYQTISNNALRWAKKNDKRRLVKQLYLTYHIH